MTNAMERLVMFMRRPTVSRTLLVLQLMAAVVIADAWWTSATGPWPNDAYAFWNAMADGQLYPEHWAPVSEFVYSPAFAQAFWPLTFLPWPMTYALWITAQLGALVWMLTPLGAIGALWFPLPYVEHFRTAVSATIYNGNPFILTAAAIVAGMRWPAAWSYVLLTKVSAGIGILYFIIRGEWRQAAIALAVTAGIVLVSFALNPRLWVDWIELLIDGAARSGSGATLDKEPFVALPLAIRGALGVIVVLVAGRGGWPWLVPVGCFLALPDIHVGGFTILWAIPALWWRSVLLRFPATEVATAAA
jgi:hypothetical protein